MCNAYRNCPFISLLACTEINYRDSKSPKNTTANGNINTAFSSTHVQKYYREVWGVRCSGCSEFCLILIPAERMFCWPSDRVSGVQEKCCQSTSSVFKYRGWMLQRPWVRVTEGTWEFLCSLTGTVPVTSVPRWVD